MIDKQDCLKWSKNKHVNPVTGRRISVTSKNGVYANYLKACQKYKLHGGPRLSGRATRSLDYYTWTVPELKKLVKEKAPSLPVLTGYNKADYIFLLIDPKHLQETVNFWMKIKEKRPREEIYDETWRQHISKAAKFVWRHHISKAAKRRK
jgi:2-cysteine adaptor domain-containing protein